MSDLTNLASRITDHANTIATAEQAIVSTFREMAAAGATVNMYCEGHHVITVTAFPAGADLEDISQAIAMADLGDSYFDELAEFAGEA